MLHMPHSRSHPNRSSAKKDRLPLARNVDAVAVGGGIHECSIALNWAKRAIDCVFLEKDAEARHALEFNSGGARILGGDIPEISLALRPLKPFTLAELAALDTVDAAS